MVSVRIAHSDADREQWHQVRIAAAPGDRAATVAEMRAMEHAGRVLLLAELDGLFAGSCVADNPAWASVSSAHGSRRGTRRRAGGTVLALALAGRSTARSHFTASCGVEDEDFVVLTHRFGFAEQIGRVGTEPEPVIPPELAIKRPDPGFLPMIQI